MASHVAPRHVLYRSYLKSLQRLPDPHAWAVMQPYYRGLLDNASDGSRNDNVHLTRIPDNASPFSEDDAPESSKAAQLRESRRVRHLKRARKELYKLQAAVACHPHALTRLLEELYGIRGRERWRIFNRIAASYPSLQGTPTRPLPPLAPPLKPLALPPVASPTPPPLERLRPPTPHSERKAEKKAWVRERNTCAVPLMLPVSQPLHSHTPTESNESGSYVDDRPIRPSNPETGLDMKVITSLRQMSSVHLPRNLIDSAHTPHPRSLSTFSSLLPHIRLLIPKRSYPLSPLVAPRSFPTGIPPAHWSDPLSLDPLDGARDGSGNADERGDTGTASVISKEEARIGIDMPSRITPRAGETRRNPRTWTFPRSFDTRMLRRAYQRLWMKLAWVRPVPQPQYEAQGGLHGRRRATQDVTANESRTADAMRDSDPKSDPASAEVWDNEEEKWESCSFHQAFPGYVDVDVNHADLRIVDDNDHKEGLDLNNRLGLALSSSGENAGRPARAGRAGNGNTLATGKDVLRDTIFVYPEAGEEDIEWIRKARARAECDVVAATGAGTGGGASVGKSESKYEGKGKGKTKAKGNGGGRV